MIEKTQLENTLLEILTQAKKWDVTGVEASAGVEAGYTTIVRKGEVETLTHHRSQEIIVTFYVGQRTGSASTSDLSHAAIKATVQKAYQIAILAQEDPYAGLPEAKYLAMDYPDLDLCHPWDATPEQAIELAKSCEEAAFNIDRRITNSEGVTVNNYTRIHSHANNYGFLGSYPTSRHSMSCMLLAKDASTDDGGMERDYDYTVSRNAKNLLSPEKLAQNAVKRAVSRLGAKRISTQKVPVILAADLARGLIGHLITGISGPALYRKASFLLDCLGQPILSSHLTLDERPHEPQGLGSAPFDSEGVKTQARQIVTDGVLQSYVLGSYSARKLGMQTTGNAGGVHNLCVTSAQPKLDLPELLKAMDTGLLVTELIGHGVNMITGDYSRGAFGYWVENGVIQYPVHEATIAGNLKEMFVNIRLMGNDVDQRGNIRTGSLLIDGMTVAGQS